MAKRKVGKEMTSRLKAALDSVKKKTSAAKPANKKPAASGPMYSPFVKKKPNLSSKQKDIAKQSGNPNKIEGSDLKKLRSGDGSVKATRRKTSFDREVARRDKGVSAKKGPVKSSAKPPVRTKSTKGRRYSSGATPMKSKPPGGSAPNRAARRRRGR